MQIANRRRDAPKTVRGYDIYKPLAGGRSVSCGALDGVALRSTDTNTPERDHCSAPTSWTCDVGISTHCARTLFVASLFISFGN